MRVFTATLVSAGVGTYCGGDPCPTGSRKATVAPTRNFMVTQELAPDDLSFIEVERVVMAE